MSFIEKIKNLIKTEDDTTEEDIIDLVNESHEQGVIEAVEAEMISNIFELGDKQANDIMTHRNNIVALDSNMTLQEAIEEMIQGVNSRYPVFDETIDNIIGILHVKDAMKYYNKEKKLASKLKNIHELLREAVFVPETKDVNELFKMMQMDKLQMVIVIDEYGQTAGLVAMEDILEEIVGEIKDEYDAEEDHITENTPDEFIVDGMTPLEDLKESLGTEFVDENYETVNGLMISKLERIPEVDDRASVVIKGYEFTILEVSNRCISKVMIQRLPEEDNPENPTEIGVEQKED